MAARKFKPRVSPPSNSGGISRYFRRSLSRFVCTGSVHFGIFTTSRSPRQRFPGEFSTRVSNPAQTCFAALSYPLFIQDRRFIQPHGWWYHDILSSTTTLFGDFVSHGLPTGSPNHAHFREFLAFIMLRSLSILGACGKVINKLFRTSY